MRNIFIQSIESLLGSYFAARCLQNSDDRIFFFSDGGEEKIKALMIQALSRIVNQESRTHNDGEALKDRLQLSCGDSHTLQKIEDPIEVWWFVSTRNKAN